MSNQSVYRITYIELNDNDEEITANSERADVLTKGDAEDAIHGLRKERVGTEYPWTDDAGEDHVETVADVSIESVEALCKIDLCADVPTYRAVEQGS